MSRGDEREHSSDVHRRLDALEQDVRRLRTRMDQWYRRFTVLERREAAMMRDVVAAVSHTVIACALIAAAVTLTVTGHDATYVWSAVGAYIVGAGVQKVAGPTAHP